MAIESQGVRFFFSTSTSLSTVAADKVGEVVSFSGPAGSAAIIDITNLDSTAKEKLPGLRDEGNVTLECNCQATNASQLYLRKAFKERLLRRVSLKMHETDDGPRIDFKAYCVGDSISGAVDDKITRSFTLEITGAASWTTT